MGFSNFNPFLGFLMKKILCIFFIAGFLCISPFSYAKEKNIQNVPAKKPVPISIKIEKTQEKVTEKQEKQEEKEVKKTEKKEQQANKQEEKVQNISETLRTKMFIFSAYLTKLIGASERIGYDTVVLHAQQERIDIIHAELFDLEYRMTQEHVSFAEAKILLETVR